MKHKYCQLLLFFAKKLHRSCKILNYLILHFIAYLAFELGVGLKSTLDDFLFLNTSTSTSTDTPTAINIININTPATAPPTAAELPGGKSNEGNNIISNYDRELFIIA